MTTEADRLEWLRSRQHFIGGSDIGPIMCDSPYSAPHDIYISKTREIKTLEDDQPTDQMRLGTHAEPMLAGIFKEDHPDWECDFSPGTVYHPEVKHFAYNPDGLLLSPEKVRTLYEAKTGRANEDWGIPPDGNIPTVYHDQVQWGMGITGCEECLVYVMLLGAFPVKYKVRFDWMLFEVLKEQADEFWKTYVVPRVEPPIDHSEKIKEELRAKWPTGKGTLGLENLPQNFHQLLDEWREVKEAKKRLERSEERLKNQFKDIIRDNDTIRINDTNVVTWKKNKDSQKTDLATVIDQLRTEATQSGKKRIDQLIKQHTQDVEGARPLVVRW